MSPVSSFALGAVIGLLGLLGLVAASRAHDPEMYAVGLVFAAFAVAFDFWLLKRWFDRATGDRGRTARAGLPGRGCRPIVAPPFRLSERPPMTTRPVDFRSDNTASVAPAIMEAIVAANRGTAPSYGNDEMTRAVDRRLSDVIETEVRVFPVATGTAANAIALSAMTRPWGGIYCHETAHIQTSECGAFEA